MDKVIRNIYDVVRPRGGRIVISVGHEYSGNNIKSFFNNFIWDEEIEVLAHGKFYSTIVKGEKDCG